IFGYFSGDGSPSFEGNHVIPGMLGAWCLESLPIVTTSRNKAKCEEENILRLSIGFWSPSSLVGGKWNHTHPSLNIMKILKFQRPSLKSTKTPIGVRDPYLLEVVANSLKVS
ncbi:hypothetical protein T310_10166, partial [Rasamsonia emersonii CBS 393.64]